MYPLSASLSSERPFASYRMLFVHGSGLFQKYAPEKPNPSCFPCLSALLSVVMTAPEASPALTHT